VERAVCGGEVLRKEYESECACIGVCAAEVRSIERAVGIGLRSLNTSGVVALLLGTAAARCCCA